LPESHDDQGVLTTVVNTTSEVLDEQSVALKRINSKADAAIERVENSNVR
jgi:hypothetical protein